MEIKIQNNGVEEFFYLNKVAKAANGSVLYKKGKAVILATITTDENASIEGDFLPLTVQYIEKSYANGKFPGGYIKREGKPNEFEILTSRLIDRSIRPLFPKNYRYPVQISIFVLSVDRDLDLQVLALNATSVALLTSNLPIDKTINALRIGKIDNEFIINPTLEQLSKSNIDLYISGENNNIFMIEFKSKEGQLDENELLYAVELAQNHINTTSNLYLDTFKRYIKPHININIQDSNLNESIFTYIENNYSKILESCFTNMAKSENNAILNGIIKEIAINNDFNQVEVEIAISKFKRNFIRNKILNEEKRLDGRGLNDIRDISIETNLLPSAHGSALFTRGQTQVLAVCTIGSDSDMQSYEILTSKTQQKSNFLFHYNFPSFSTGEAYPIGSVNRRELGHGNLAKKALESSLRNENRAVRIVAEVLESNGSSSMASVCGGSLSLCAAGIEAEFLVAGIAMGLIKDGDKYKILTDIMGIEDYDGDMDFKVAGNRSGITALQMDIKINDINIYILRDALLRAKEARLSILDKMEIAKENIILNDNTPVSQVFKIPINKIPSIIGQGGKNIKDIIERFCISIDINKENGEVRISGESKENVQKAKDFILSSVYICLDSFKVGDRFSGKIKRITDFGIFVEIKDGIDGLLHNSKLIKNNINIRDFKEGDRINVEIAAINNDKIELIIS
ncbi:polyribonucleotide nucleotidyltransferase [Helicobacter sp. 16-1353]|uniref:polyribonucleotide nucleotidyltransferase n=1 Tax=Helicobacter sp. 16-1353 TaxID=2004996 RepID=UPI000DCBC714|nr:polyribonucleotide nucleotidyltransferase [Helicobacter sp. 16-1353]RAX54285.1 polyribonucleotide nucleotidyltransferase [Helicobacter sp. 16-1353]